MKITNEIKWWVGFIILGLAFSTIASAFYGVEFVHVLKALFGSVFVLFLPGYVIMRCFFNDLEDWIEKGAVSFGLSIAVVITTVIIANVILKIKITALSTFLILLASMFITFGIKFFVDKAVKQKAKKPKKIKK